MAVRPRPALVDKNFKLVSKRIEGFNSSYVSKSVAKGLVVGLSGGLDTAAVLRLAVIALGTAKVLGILMTSGTTPTEDVDHAKSLGIIARKFSGSHYAANYSQSASDIELFGPNSDRNFDSRHSIRYNPESLKYNHAEIQDRVV